MSARAELALAPTEAGPAPAASAPSGSVAGENVALELRRRAAERPFQRALVVPRGRDGDGRRRYAHVTYAALQARVDRIAHALRARGVAPGEPVLVLVPPGIDFVAVVYALMLLGAPPILIDPGNGVRGLLDGIEQAAPRTFVGVGKAHLALRLLGRRAARSVTRRICVGRRPTGGLLEGASLEALLRAAPDGPFPAAAPDPAVPAAILFTSGSTGPPKGVVYQHGTFQAQVRLLREVWGLGPDDVDLPGLPVFALFSAALGATVAFPDMDASRPARLDPRAWAEVCLDQGATYSFGSPAIWGPVAAWCRAEGVRLPSLRHVLMAGAPVPPRLHEDLRHVLDDSARTHTPYGATEALPVTTATGRELEPFAPRTEQGQGTCVGRPVPGVEVRVIAITDEALPAWRPELALPPGEVGELLVAGPVVTERYFAREDATARSKVREGARVWHRMGDLGYRDAEGRVWFCGRQGQRVTTAAGPLDTDKVEPIFARHPRARRVALVGVGPAGAQTPVLVVEPARGAWPASSAARAAFTAELRALGAAHPHTAPIERVLFRRALPVDARHNAKIRRELLASWAASRV